MATTVPMDYRMLIDGELVDSDGGTFAVTNPATGEEIATVPNATVEDVDARDRQRRARARRAGARRRPASARRSCAPLLPASAPRRITSAG